VGRFKLKAGNNKLVFTVTGKGPESAGLLMGLDQIQLVPVSAS